MPISLRVFATTLRFDFVRVLKQRVMWLVVHGRAGLKTRNMLEILEHDRNRAREVRQRESLGNLKASARHRPSVNRRTSASR